MVNSKRLKRNIRIAYVLHKTHNRHHTPFSMHDYQTVYFNKLLLDRCILKLDLDPTSPKIAAVYDELLQVGEIAA